MIGQQFGHYEVESRLGSGGVGEVYLARDLRLDRRVAIKILSERRVADERARTRFRREAQALSRLNHPNIATIFDFDQADGRDFLVMEYIEGRSLRELAPKGQPMPTAEVVRLGVQLGEALVAAHGAGVVHLDLKPGNLMLTADGRLKVLDFGIARLHAPDERVDRDAGQETGTAANAAGTPPVHGARTGGRGSGRSPHRYLRRGRDALRARHRTPRVRQAARHRPLRVDPARQAGCAEPAQSGIPPRSKTR